MLNPGVPKCHEDLIITLETYIQQRKTINNKFFIYVPQCDKKITSVWGGGGFNKQTVSWFTSTLSFILIYMSNMEAI